MGVDRVKVVVVGNTGLGYYKEVESYDKYIYIYIYFFFDR